MRHLSTFIGLKFTYHLLFLSRVATMSMSRTCYRFCLNPTTHLWLLCSLLPRSLQFVPLFCLKRFLDLNVVSPVPLKKKGDLIQQKLMPKQTESRAKSNKRTRAVGKKQQIFQLTTVVTIRILRSISLTLSTTSYQNQLKTLMAKTHLYEKI